jgi:HEAT repeat protein
VYAITRFQEDAAPLYVVALKDKEPHIRWTAASYLGQFPKAAKQAIPQLLELAKTDPDANVRYYCTSSLSTVGVEAIPALTELATSKEQNVYQTAMHALRNHGAKSKGAVPNLIETLKGGDIQARRLAAITLGAIGPDAKDALDALKEAAKGSDATLSTLAEQAIKSIEKK